MSKRIKVLDKGYISLVDHMGNDLRVVNAARASLAKYSEEMTEKNVNFTRFLSVLQHTVPMRHCMMTFEVKAPIGIARQWWKAVVGSDHTMEAWSEASYRYISNKLEFYIPSKWRKKPDNMKQGSGGFFDDETNKQLQEYFEEKIDKDLADYKHLIDNGVAPEQARSVLPANNQYTMWYWTTSLQSVLNFLVLRLDSHAQWEIQQYASAIQDIVKELFPLNYNYYMSLHELFGMISNMIKSDDDFEKVKELLSRGIE